MLAENTFDMGDDRMFNNGHRTGQRDAMQVCLNGHVINADFHKYPELNKDFCECCGEETITNCPNSECGKPIPGNLRRVTGFPLKSRQSAPNFCPSCSEPFPWNRKKAAEDFEAETENPMEVLQKVFSRFHLITQKLRKRYGGREPFEVTDEHDVQDLLDVLLTPHFGSIRPEETTPGYAGKSARIDFLLKEEKIGIEVKMTRKGLTAKGIGDQLIVDIARYKEHPNCDTLICFIYDPEYKIKNRHPLIEDLQKQSTDTLKVVVFIHPS
ncbi:MAG: DUF2321 domain-containing protein [Candidatus Poribacteria bacterium]|nr:DUF2321 domain-containing protein [Candidatus Poribacteria bacterium]